VKIKPRDRKAFIDNTAVRLYGGGVLDAIDNDSPSFPHGESPSDYSVRPILRLLLAEHGGWMHKAELCSKYCHQSPPEYFGRSSYRHNQCRGVAGHKNRSEDGHKRYMFASDIGTLVKQGEVERRWNGQHTRSTFWKARLTKAGMARHLADAAARTNSK
jgi:hypothetical protein